jgi:hypothetical protein
MSSGPPPELGAFRYDDHPALGCEQITVARVARAQHAIHQVDAAGHVLGQFRRHADTRGIAQLGARQDILGGLHGFHTERARFAGLNAELMPRRRRGGVGNLAEGP